MMQARTISPGATTLMWHHCVLAAFQFLSFMRL
jgi:hypothetical protein